MHRTRPARYLTLLATTALTLTAACGPADRGRTYAYADAVEHADALEAYNMSTTVRITEDQEVTTLRLDCDVFTAEGATCAIDADVDGEQLSIGIALEYGGDVVYVGGDFLETFLEEADDALGLGSAQWLALSVDDFDAEFGSNPATVDLSFVSSFASLEPVDNGMVERDGERLRSYTVTIDEADVATVFGLQQESLDLDTDSIGPVAVEVLVSEASQIRAIEYTIVTGALRSEFTVEIDDLPSDATFALPSGPGVVDLTDIDVFSAACAAGDMDACDTLYFESPAGSDDEAFGASCGGTTDGWTAGQCGLSPTELIEQSVQAITREADSIAMFNDGDDLGRTTVANLHEALVNAAVYGDLAGATGDVALTDDDPVKDCYELTYDDGNSEPQTWNLTVGVVDGLQRSIIADGPCS